MHIIFTPPLFTAHENHAAAAGPVLIYKSTLPFDIQSFSFLVIKFILGSLFTVRAVWLAARTTKTALNIQIGIGWPRRAHAAREWKIQINHKHISAAHREQFQGMASDVKQTQHASYFFGVCVREENFCVCLVCVCDFVAAD